MKGNIWRYRNLELIALLAAGAVVLLAGLPAGDARIDACARPPAWSRTASRTPTVSLPPGVERKADAGVSTAAGAGAVSGPAAPEGGGTRMPSPAQPGEPAAPAAPGPAPGSPPESDGSGASKGDDPGPLFLGSASSLELREVLSRGLPPATVELLAGRIERALREAGWWSRMHLSLQTCFGVDAKTFRGNTIPGLTLAVWQDLRRVLAVRSPLDAKEAWRIHLGAFPALFLLVHLFLRSRRRSGGELYLPAALLFTAFTAVVLYQFQDPLRDNPLAFAYTEGVAGACAVMALAAGVVRLADLERYKYLTILAALGLSVLLVLFGTGPEGTDTRINLFGFQPVEFVKLLVVLFLAAYLSERENELRSLDAFRIGFISLPRIRDIYPVAVFMAASLVFFFLQKDLGPALVLYLVFVCLFAVVSRRGVLGLGGFALLTGAFWFCYRHATFQTVTTRIEMWLSPWDNHRPGGLQLAESLWAFASGGTSGSGAGLASPQFVPAGHTDLILAASGEVYGFTAVALLLGGCAFLFGMMVLHAYRARHVYAGYLGFGLALLFGVQAAVISAGAVGLLPLTGIPFPLVGYGKSATIAAFLLVGLMINVASRPRPAEPRPVKLAWTALPVPAAVLLTLFLSGHQAWRVMGPEGDAILVRPCLVPQADGVRRYAVNRRVLALADAIPRGVIRDRNGVPLAAASPDEVRRAAAVARELGLTPPEADGRTRVYPFGPLTVQLLGCFQDYWSDERTVEKRYDNHLRGYRYAERVERVDGNRVVFADYAGLAGPFRDRGTYPEGRLGEVLRRDRDVTLALDIRLQAAAAEALRKNFPVIDGVPRTAGAAAVLDAADGGLLVCLSLPGFDPNLPPDPARLRTIHGPEGFSARDRCRFEIYPPGSTFKVVTAAAALAEGMDPDRETVVCTHETVVPWTWGGKLHKRGVTDDRTERAHGRIAMPRALIESCNVYFAWLGTRLGAGPLFAFCRTALGLQLAGVKDAAALEPNLPDNAYGQAMVTVTPLEMARVAALAANGGFRVDPCLALSPREEVPSPAAVFRDPTAAARLREWMVRVVTEGTGRRAAVEGLVVGGKTGTAQNASGDRQSHAWFIGFADPLLEGGNPIAFAFLVENGGYGGRTAAPAARDFLAAVKEGKLYPEPAPPLSPPPSPPSPPVFPATGLPVTGPPAVEPKTEQPPWFPVFPPGAGGVLPVVEAPPPAPATAWATDETGPVAPRGPGDLSRADAPLAGKKAPPAARRKAPVPKARGKPASVKPAPKPRGRSPSVKPAPGRKGGKSAKPPPTVKGKAREGTSPGKGKTARPVKKPVRKAAPRPAR